MLFKVTNTDGDVELVNTDHVVSVFPETDDDNKKTGKSVIVTDQIRTDEIGPITRTSNKVVIVCDSVDAIYNSAVKAERSLIDVDYEPDQL